MQINMKHISPVLAAFRKDASSEYRFDFDLNGEKTHISGLWLAKLEH